ncbi:MAG: acyltransferase family protein [Desulfurivibrionaceae bacterium]
MPDLLRFPPFDRLRYLIIILVVLQHGADSYGEVVSWWYVRDPDPASTQFFDLFRLLPDIIMMPALFFLAGFFALPSLRKKGLGRFLGSKAVRLLGPWLVCVTLVVPVIHYIYHLARADPVYQKGFFYYWALFLGDARRFHLGFIHSMDQFNLNYAWFISLLFFFFLFFGLGHAIKGKLSAGRKTDPKGPGLRAFRERGGKRLQDRR